MSQVHAHQLRAEVQIALARAVGEPAAFGVGDVQRLPRFLEAPRAEVGLRVTAEISSEVKVFGLLMVAVRSWGPVFYQTPIVRSITACRNTSCLV